MPEVGAVTFNDIEDVIVKATGKIAVSEIFRSRDDKFVGKVADRTVAPKGVMNEYGNHYREKDEKTHKVV